MKHKYNREYDYSDKFAAVRISMDRKMRLKDYADSLCDPDTGFVSMKDVLDDFLDGKMDTIENYIEWLKNNNN